MPGAAACKVLDEVSVLYTWDRPALFSPIKSARRSDLKLGNTVFLVTRLPATLEDQVLGMVGGEGEGDSRAL